MVPKRQVGRRWRPRRYQLKETNSANYCERTERNVLDSEGTLIVNLGELEGGSLQTLRFAEKHQKPCLVLQLDEGVHILTDCMENATFGLE
jgi:Circularly permutated YpsA SLOG family